MIDPNKINEIEKLISTSPIRNYLKTQKRVSFFDQEKSELNDIDTRIKADKDNINNSLKIVVLGEVKAGKSTLVNSLIGKKVSYTNVVEATSAILEINYSSQEKIIITKNKGDAILLTSLRELDDLIQQNKNNTQFFDEIKTISILTDTERLKEISLVDTPGLNTVTTSNEKRTEEYIKNANVILWILNCHHLGQSDVSEKINEVSNYGKPMICIINRIDESDSEADKLIDYVEDEMGCYFDEIFATSAKMAWDGYSENDIMKITNSNVEDLYSYVLDNIEKSADDVQLKSIGDSINIQIKRDLNIHKNSKLRIEGIVEDLNKDIKEFEKFNCLKKDNISNKIDNWINLEFFQEEKSKLMNSNKIDELNQLFKLYSDNKYLEQIIDKKYKSLSNYITSEWQNNVQGFIGNQSLNQLNLASSIDSTSIVNSPSSENEYILEGVKQTGAAAGAIGLGLAGYAAWLGPASAYVTIGSALSSIVPPVLIIGLIGGAVWKFMNKEKMNNEKHRQIDLLEAAIKTTVKGEILSNMKQNLFDMSDNYMRESCKMVHSILNQCNTSYNEINKINNDIQKYIENVEKLIVL